MKPFTLLLPLLILGCSHRGEPPRSAAPHPGVVAPALQPPPDLARPPPHARVSSTGLASVVLRAGAGRQRPDVDDRVLVHYTGWTIDGTMIDSTVQRGHPATFSRAAVIPGFSEGLGEMVVGEVRRLWIPAHLAYKGNPSAPQGMLVFDVALMGIE